MKTFYYNRLPHWVPIGATVFVTFRTHDSIPKDVYAELKKKFIEINAKLQLSPSGALRKELLLEKRKLLGLFNRILDEAPEGLCPLKNEAVAKTLVDKMHQFENTLYYIEAYCIMPNHVHLLLDLSCQKYDDNYKQLDYIMKMIKGGSAFEINKILGHKGTFWCKDSYDHWVRHQKSRERIRKYILNNPTKAKLVEDWTHWPYSYTKASVAATSVADNQALVSATSAADKH